MRSAASMMQQAAHDATLYCAEARRTVILPRDIELALKRLVLPGSAYWSRDNLPEEAQRIRHATALAPWHSHS
jgi:hypothetical protein|eukprot:COSAG01_NODE_5858_length_3987_cov_188.262346_1_plen_73_part_00